MDTKVAKDNIVEEVMMRPTVRLVDSSSFVSLLLLALSFLSCKAPERRESMHENITRRIAAQSAEEIRKGLAAARELPGYELFEDAFSLKEARFGLINSMPESLFIEIESTRLQPIDAVWWWNPLTNGEPSLTWHDFINSFNAAERIVEKHRWLAELRHVPGKRSLELHLLGRGVGANADDLRGFILPPWQHAGMAGQPQYCFLSRSGDRSWIQFFFSDEDDRAFVRYSLSNPNPKKQLDSFALHWHPRGKRGETSSQYATIASDGRVTLHTFVMDER